MIAMSLFSRQLIFGGLGSRGFKVVRVWGSSPPLLKPNSRKKGTLIIKGRLGNLDPI